MSYFQPLITSAFSDYSVSRNYVDRVTDLERSVVERRLELGRGGLVLDADAGKPRSESGDILDLSVEVRERGVELVRSGSVVTEEVESGETGEAVKSSDDLVGELSGVELTPEEQEQVRELKARDQEVRIHEAAHVAVGGSYVTGGPTYSYQTGPDGKQYAVGGEVGIDTGEVSGDPEATIRKMQTVAAAALAPAEPSGQDQKVAAAARQKEAQARAELARQDRDRLNLGENSEVSSSLVATEDEPELAAATENKPELVSSSPLLNTTNAEGRGELVGDFGESDLRLSQHGSSYLAQSSLGLRYRSRFSVFV
jgi:hypothetical protein